MVVRIVLVAAVIAAALVVVQQQQMLQNAGLTGYCTTVATPKGETGFWHECHPGKLTGTPELSRSGSCTRIDTAGSAERWRCETPLERTAASQ